MIACPPSCQLPNVTNVTATLTFSSQSTVEAAKEGEEKVLCSSPSSLLWLPCESCHLLYKIFFLSISGQLLCRSLCWIRPSRQVSHGDLNFSCTNVLYIVFDTDRSSFVMAPKWCYTQTPAFSQGFKKHKLLQVHKYADREAITNWNCFQEFWILR